MNPKTFSIPPRCVQTSTSHPSYPHLSQAARKHADISYRRGQLGSPISKETP